MERIQTGLNNRSGVTAFVPRGSGAYVIHRQLEEHIENYRMFAYNPRMEYFPFALPIWASKKLSDSMLVHSSLDYGWMYRKKGVPLILTAHNYVLGQDAFKYSTFKQRIHYATDLRISTQLSIREADLVVCVSDYTKNVVCNRYNIENKVIVIYNGIDCERFSPATIDRNRHGTFKILFAGNLTLRKGAQWIPGIAARLEHGVEIHIATGLRDTGYQVTSDNVKFIGRVSHAEMPSLYREYDALLAPTVLEGFGLSIAEAMACGLPVVASDCSFVPQLVHEGAGGYLCRVGDVVSFAEAINSLAKSPKTCVSMGQYNRQRIVTCFPLMRMINAYIDLFRSYGACPL